VCMCIFFVVVAIKNEKPKTLISLNVSKFETG